MFRVIPLKNLKRNNQPLDWEGTHCWQILKGGASQKKIGDASKKDSKEEKENENVLASLCASDDGERDKWMGAIKDFHNCGVKEGPVASKTNFKLSSAMDKDVIVESERDAKDQEEIKKLDDSLDEVDSLVADNVEKMKLQKTKHKRAIEDEDAEIEDLEDKEKCLSDSLIEEAKKQELEREKAIKLVGPNMTATLKNITVERMDRIIQEEDQQMYMRK